MTAIWNNPATPNGPAQGNPQVPGRPGQPQPGDAQNQQNPQNPQPQQARPMGGPVGQATATVEAKAADETAEKQEQADQPEAAKAAETEAKESTEADNEATEAKEATESAEVGEVGEVAEVKDASEGGEQSDAVAKPADAKVKGQIEIADEVVEKVSALAALEVEGVVDLGGDVARLLENVRERIGVGQKRGDQGVKATITGDEVSINLTIVVEYGHVVMEVARSVQSNVAEQAHKMLGLRVASVNVKVDDVQLPQAATAGRRRDDSAASGEGAAE